MSDTETSQRKLPTRQVCQRYSVSDRTIARWERDPDLKFPAPDTINGRKYFNESDLIEWERSRAGRAA